MSIADSLAAYGAAWSESDAAKRDALLEQAWAEDGVYRDPMADVAGRAGLSAHIGGFLASQPGARIELTSAPSLHHGHIYFTWRMVAADGSVSIEGVDFGSYNGDEQITQIVGFFGPPPPLA